MRRWLIGGIIVIVCVACAAIPLFLRSASGGRFGPSTPVNLQTVKIDKGGLRSVVTATGSVVVNDQSNLSFDQPGVVVALSVAEGQHVEAGQVLASLDDTTQKFNVQQAQYVVQAAQAALNKLLEPVDAGDVANAEAQVKAAEAAFSARASSVDPSTIQAANLQYQQALANLQTANKQRADAGGQYSNTDPNYLKYVAQIGIDQNNADIAKLKAQQLAAGSSMESATANIAYMQARLAQTKAGTNQIDIDDAQAQLATAQLQETQAQHQLDHMHLIAPYAGTITTVNIKLGELSSGTAVVLTDDSILFVDVQVDETDIGKVQVGQSVEMTLDALPDAKLTGKVQRINQVADTSTSVTTYTVRVVLDKTTAPIKVGMTTNATFVIASLQNVLRIPNQFIKQNRTTGQNTVDLVNPDGTYTEVPVKIGVQGTDDTEVIEGLTEGDTVALVLKSS